LQNILQKFSSYLSRKNTVHGLMLVPALFFYIPFFVIPIVLGLALSFADWSGISGSLSLGWNGIENYVELANDRKFWSSLRITFKFVAMTVAPILIFSLLLSNAIHSSLSLLSETVKIAILTPIAMSAVSIGILATFFFSPTIGIPTLISDRPVDIFADPNGALVTIAIAHIWGGVGFSTFIYLAGLQAIPEVLYEAAKIDGANVFARFWKVTVPLLRETTIINLILIVIIAFRSFGLIYTMTRGGPYRATEVLSFFMYKQAFVSFRMSYGSAVAVILFLIILALTLFQLRATRSGSSKFY